MNREQAKIWCKLTPEELKDLGFPCYAEHYNIMKKFANGSDVCEPGHGILTDPRFTYGSEYQIIPPEIEVLGVKVRANPPETEPPRVNSTIYHLAPDEISGYLRSPWCNSKRDLAMLKRGFVFKNKADAITVAQALGWCDDE